MKEIQQQLFAKLTSSELAITREPVEEYVKEVLEAKRNVRIGLIVVMLFVLIGTLAFNSLEPTNFPNLYESFYFSCVTLTTVGYGDYLLTTDSGKGFWLFFAVMGCGLAAKAATEMAALPSQLHAMKVSN